MSTDPYNSKISKSFPSTLNEQEPDLASVLEMARSLREQIDWDFVRARTASSPFARAFFTLVEELGVVDAA
jgi:hypothetical protein